MTSRILYICILCIRVCSYAFSQQPPAQQQAIVLKRQIQRNHFSSAQVDDSLSAHIFKLFIKSLDPQHDLLTEEEFKSLAAYQYLLDDELNNGSWKFLDLATRLYRKALQRADSITRVLLQKPLDFTKADKLVIYRNDKEPFPKNANEMMVQWSNWSKFVLLTQANSMASADSTKPGLQNVVVRNENTLREKFRKGQERIFNKLLDPSTFETSVKEIYFNSVAAAFDPHTNYFSPQDQQKFQAELSTEEYSFGFETDETKEGKIIIASLIPGGPAWKTGELHKNDELIQLQWKGKQSIDVASITIDEVDEMLDEPGQNELIVKVRKTDGTIRTVTLRREKIETEQEVVKGFLLSGEKKIGYISLPDFYTSWEDESGSGCANDMAKEIIKMKRENLDGLILDVRYNGGGSLYEALQLCGIFIDEGPLVGIKEKEGKLVFDKDPNRGTIYDGPLLVLVNNQSASASEMLAAALQDYNRAVIVGSPTYGKATMQQVFPMDSSGVKKKDSPNGYVKITTGKLYRLNGETAQCNGVVPDILLPDAFDGLDYREKFMPYVLPGDTAKKNGYYKVLPPLPVAQLLASSNDRVKKDSSFTEIVQGIQRRGILRASEQVIIPLQPLAFEKWIKEREDINKALDAGESIQNKTFVAGNYQMEKQRIQNNSYAAELNEALLNSIQHDIYIQEAYRILIDLISLQKSK